MIFGAPSSIASFSMASNPSQNWCAIRFFSLGMDLPRFSKVALDLFSSEDGLVPPVLFCPWGGELVFNITKFGSSVRILVAPLPCPVILDRCIEIILVGSVCFVYIVLLRFDGASLFKPRYVT